MSEWRLGSTPRSERDVYKRQPSITSVGAFLCPVKNGSVDSDHWIARQLGQKLGDITLDIPEGKLKDGDVVRLILNYEMCIRDRRKYFYIF